MAAEPTGFTFLQISDSHVGFDKPANPNALGTLEEAIDRIKAMPAKPSFMIHTGDISHLSKASEFDDAERIISQAKLDVHYVPGEHDFLDEEIKFYKDRYGKGRAAPASTRSTPTACTSSASSTWSTSRPAASAISAPSSSNGWSRISRAARSRRRSWCSRISRCGPCIRNGAGAPRTARRALDYLKGFGSVTVLNGHIHQVMQKVEGNVTFHTARSTAFPQPAPGTAPSPGPMKVPDDKLRGMLGIASVNFKRVDQPLAIIDTPLAG